MSLPSAIPTMVVTVGAALAIELRRVSEIQAAVAERRSADALARATRHRDAS